MGRFTVFLIGFLVFSPVASSETLELHIDADYSVHSAGAEAIELGVRTALAEEDLAALGLTIEVVAKDHRANSRRSAANLKAFLKNQSALAIIGGVHSPPYLVNREFMNEKGVLALLPWSAAGPITRAREGHKNWIFRLSIDDTKAGPYLVKRALQEGGCLNTTLLLLDTGWGRANRKTMSNAFEAARRPLPEVVMFDASIGKATAQSIATDIVEGGSDCVILLANTSEGADLVKALHSLDPSLRVFSHWGILAGDFPGVVSKQVRDDLQIEVLQTCGLRVENEGRSVLQRALKAAGDFTHLSSVTAATGFVHGYDLTKILLAAIQQVHQRDSWKKGSIDERRALIRDELEALSGPIAGILKDYSFPFRPYSQTEPDGHEALGVEDLCVARFAGDGKLVLAPNRRASGLAQ